MSERPGKSSPEGEGHRERTLGPTLISRLHAVMRGMRLYDASNRALHSQQQELLEAVQALMEDEVSLLGMGEYFYVNGVRLRPAGPQLATFRAVLAELEARELGGLRFSAGLQLEELEGFLRAFHGVRGARSTAALEDASNGVGGRHIGPIRARDAVAPADAPEDHSPEGERTRARATFRRAMSATRELMLRTARTGRPAMQQARRVVQPIVDKLLKSETSLVGLTALKQHDEYTYAHCVNVSILAVRMGQALGFSRAELASVGVAALLHDTGKLAVPVEVLRKPGRLDAGEWAAILRHPIEGLRLVSRLPGLSPLQLDAMRVALEHHMNVDHSGYPASREPRELSPLSRVVAVADFFDAITSHRAYRPRTLTPNEALRLLLGPEHVRFDRAALWALVQTVGLYPAGTLFRTASGQLMLAVSPSPDDFRRPVCRPIRVVDGLGGVVTGPDVPLAPSERVANVVTPEELDLDIEGLLAA